MDDGIVASLRGIRQQCLILIVLNGDFLFRQRPVIGLAPFRATLPLPDLISASFYPLFHVIDQAHFQLIPFGHPLWRYPPIISRPSACRTAIPRGSAHLTGPVVRR